MKNVLKWLLRIICIVIIGAAVFTLGRSLLHMHDDHSYETLMGERPPVEAEAVTQPPAEESQAPAQTLAEQISLTLEASGSATMDSPEVQVTATFDHITGSVQANLIWYLDGEELGRETKLLVNGATALYNIPVDVESAEADDTIAEVMAQLEDGTVISAGAIIPVERMQEDTLSEVRTEEIVVTCIEDCSIYRDLDLSQDTGGILYQGETGLLLAYETGSGGLGALHLQFGDGTDGWVSARRCEITEENCTTDLDYTEQQKMDFVNDMGYDSDTGFLIWVNLYTQKVNVFYGTKGNWTLYAAFPCATGSNTNPTSTGVYSITDTTEQWDMGDTYYAPVIIFNGGEAFTGQPRSSVSDQIIDDTMGSPASGGSVWMEEDAIEWMYDYVTIGTAVVVY